MRVNAINKTTQRLLSYMQKQSQRTNVNYQKNIESYGFVVENLERKDSKVALRNIYDRFGNIYSRDITTSNGSTYVQYNMNGEVSRVINEDNKGNMLRDRLYDGRTNKILNDTKEKAQIPLNDTTLRIKSYIQKAKDSKFNYHQSYENDGIITDEKLVMHKISSTKSFSYDKNGNIQEQTIVTPKARTVIQYDKNGKIKSVTNMDNKSIGAKRYREYDTKTGKVIRDTAKENSYELINGTTKRIENYIQQIRKSNQNSIYFPIDDARGKMTILLNKNNGVQIANYYNPSGNVVEQIIETPSRLTKVKYDKYGRKAEATIMNPITRETIKNRKYN